MEALLNQLIRLLVSVGPWIVLAATFMETAFFIGLLVPAEAIVLLAAVLADHHKFTLTAVISATFCGAFLGDQAGYWVGRLGGTRMIARAGYIGNVWRWYEPITLRLFRQSPIVSVTLARFVSFVRTLMPWFAGMRQMPYVRFVIFDFLGVLGWSFASVAVGYAAGASWKYVAQTIGQFTAYILGGVLVLGLLFELRRRIRVKLLSRRILRVALTGNIASGKSTVAEIWRGLGAPVIDADVLARKAIGILLGFAGVALIAINRAALRDIVFNDEAKRKRLETIIHPEVARLRETEELRLAAAGETIIVSDIPLLFETGLDRDYDVIVLVDAAEDVRIDRIVRDRGLDAKTAREMVAAQTPAVEKRAGSTYVIENEGSRDMLADAARDVWHMITERAS